MGESELKEKFIEYSEKRGYYLGELKSFQKANKVSDEITSLVIEIKSMGQPGFQILMDLTEHQNTWVAVNAAGALWPEFPEVAKDTMQKIANQSLGIPSAEANIALTVWKQGKR